MVDVAGLEKDEDLLVAAREGALRAFEALVERHFGVVYAIAYSRLGHRETAEDLAQEVFLRAYLSLDKLKQPSRFAAWLSIITHNIVTDWQRSGKNRSDLTAMVSVDKMAETLSDTKGKGAREQMDRQEQDEAVRKAIFELPPDQREIVLLHFGEGLNQKEIADRLNIHPATVGRQIKRSLASLKVFLEPLVRESVGSLRPTRKAVARTALIVGAAATLSVPAKSALAIAAGVVAQTSAEALAMSSSSGGLLKTISAVFFAGGKIMAIGKTVAALTAAAAIVGGGAFYANQSKAEKVTGAVSGAENKKEVSSVGKRKGFPDEVYAFLEKAYEEDWKKADPVGKRYPVTYGIAVHSASEVWSGVYFKGPKLSKSGVQEISIGSRPNPESSVFYDKDGNLVKFRFTNEVNAIFGGNPVYLQIDEPLSKDEELSIFEVAPQKVTPSGPDSFSIRLPHMRGQADSFLHNYYLFIAPGSFVLSSSEEPASRLKIGDWEVVIFRKETKGEAGEIKMTIQKSNALHKEVKEDQGNRLPTEIQSALVKAFEEVRSEPDPSKRRQDYGNCMIVHSPDEVLDGQVIRIKPQKPLSGEVRLGNSDMRTTATFFDEEGDEIRYRLVDQNQMVGRYALYLTFDKPVPANEEKNIFVVAPHESLKLDESGRYLLELKHPMGTEGYQTMCLVIPSSMEMVESLEKPLRREKIGEWEMITWRKYTHGEPGGIKAWVKDLGD